MNKETLKSAIIGLLAAAALVCWLKFQPRLPDVAPKEKIGQKLFPAFDDPEKMRRVEFVAVDPESGETKTLTLVRDGADWRLPEKTNFPAENAERLAKVVAPLTQLAVLDVAEASETGDDPKKIERWREECGVLDPETAADREPPTAALSVKIDGENGERFVDLIVGNRAPESSATRDVRYVRVPGDDGVYIVDFSGDSTTETGTTEFAEFPERISFEPLDWADRDVLRVSRWDVSTLAARDYTFSTPQTPADENAENAAPAVQLQSPGIAVFRQNPENSLSRVWSLSRRVDRDATSGAWREADAASLDPESAQNDVLNETADALGRLTLVDVRRKPDALARLFRENRLGAELATQRAALAEFGFATFDFDPLNPENIGPALVGESGGIDLTTKDGVAITLLFGKKIGENRAVVAFAHFDRAALARELDDETELDFLAQDAEKKAKIKNDRLADWVYLISEADFQKIRFRFPDVLKN